MSCLRSFHARKYRGISGLELGALAPRINLITGGNGVGKTALLEALWLFHGRHNTSLAWNRNVHRGAKPPLDAVSSLSPAGDAVELSGTERGKEFRLRLKFEHFSSIAPERVNGNGGAMPSTDVYAGLPFPVVGRLRVWLNGAELVAESAGQSFLQTPKGGIVCPAVQPTPGQASGVIVLDDPRMSKDHVQRYSEIVNQGEKQYMLGVLRAVRPSVKDVEILIDLEGEPYVSATLEDEDRRALHELGGGMMRLFRFVVDAFAARGGILLVDEIENGLHYKVLPNVWRHLREISERLNVQVFATTHSAECIDAAITAFRGHLADLAVHGLFLNEENEVQATCLTGDCLDGASELDLEMR